MAPKKETRKQKKSKRDKALDQDLLPKDESNEDEDHGGIPAIDFRRQLGCG